ncbi:hypothetical protein CBL_13100 [Carabus blaptoides fortunei]
MKLEHCVPLLLPPTHLTFICQTEQYWFNPKPTLLVARQAVYKSISGYSQRSVVWSRLVRSNRTVFTCEARYTEVAHLGLGTRDLCPITNMCSKTGNVKKRQRLVCKDNAQWSSCGQLEPLLSRISGYLLFGDSARDKPENETKQNAILKKFNELNEWYIKVTGLDEVKMLQNRVIATQEKLEKAQEERREMGKLLVDVRKRSTDLQEQLQKVQRWQNPEIFLDLTREETLVMKTEKELGTKFEILDKAEREIFTALSNAVRDSHEKEKAQSEYTKYWGIILSIAGTLVGTLLSTIISTMRNRQLVNGINSGMEQKLILMANKINEETAMDEHVDRLVYLLQNSQTKSTRPIMEKLDENNKQIGLILQSIKSRYLLSTNQVTGYDKFVNIGAFMTAQVNLLKDHQAEIRQIITQSYSSEMGETGLKIVFFGGALLVCCILFCR